jgi:uncharacterized protein YkwD
VQRIWGSLIVFAFAAMAAFAVGGPGVAKRVAFVTSHVGAGPAPAAGQRHAQGQDAQGADAVSGRFPERDSRDPAIGAGVQQTPGQTPAPGSTPARPGQRPASPTSPGARTPAPVPAGGSPAEQQIARAVFQAINDDRAAAGRPPLAWNSGLARSARQHDLAMAAANTLSHQLPGEAPFGTRESQQGVAWTWAGENCGYTSDRTTAGALGIHRAMMAEQPPDDGHRQNILTTTGNQVGVDIVLDSAHGRLWLTEDFAKT